MLTHANSHMHAPPLTHACPCTSTHAHISTLITHIYSHPHTRTHTCLLAHPHTCMHTHTHTCMFMHTPRWWSLCSRPEARLQTVAWHSVQFLSHWQGACSEDQGGGRIAFQNICSFPHYVEGMSLGGGETNWKSCGFVQEDSLPLPGVVSAVFIFVSFPGKSRIC